MKKLVTFDRIVSILVVTLIGLIGVVAFASDYDEYVNQTHTLILFVAIVVTGLGLAIAGIVQLLLKGVNYLFGSGALITFGALGILVGATGQEALAGILTSYLPFLAKHYMPLSLMFCALVAAHILVERPIIKRRARSHG